MIAEGGPAFVEGDVPTRDRATTALNRLFTFKKKGGNNGQRLNDLAQNLINEEAAGGSPERGTRLGGGRPKTRAAGRSFGDEF
jgi:hypothetical protein